MKAYFSILVTLLTLTFCSTSNADVTNIICYDSYNSSGGFAMSSGYSWTTVSAANHEYSMTMVGDYYAAPWGSVYGDIFTTDASDPTLTLHTIMENDTITDTWIGMHINVSLNTTFTISAAQVFAPAGWTALVVQPTFNGTVWLGTVDYSAGIPVAPGDTLDFQYLATFSGLTQFAFNQEIIPVLVPEPTTFSLIGLGLLAMGYRKLSRRG